MSQMHVTNTRILPLLVCQKEQYYAARVEHPHRRLPHANIRHFDKSIISQGGPTRVMMLLGLANHAMTRLPAELLRSSSPDCLSLDAAVKAAVSQTLAELALDPLWGADLEWNEMLIALLYNLLEPSCPFPTGLIKSLGLAVLADHLLPDWSNPSAAKTLAHSEFERFSTHIRPRIVGRVAWNRTIYVERLKQYASCRSLTDEQIRSEVLRIANGGIDQSSERFFKRVPLSRIRTYTDSMISDIIRNFLE